jgi:hypothetical protein
MFQSGIMQKQSNETNGFNKKESNDRLIQRLEEAERNLVRSLELVYLKEQSKRRER